MGSMLYKNHFGVMVKNVLGEYEAGGRFLRAEIRW